MSASASSSSESEPKIIDDAVYKEGDMTILSSDKVPVRFRLPSFYLLAVSSVIRDMYEVGSSVRQDIAMSDGTTETAEKLRPWLDMVTGKPTPDRFETKALNIMMLARKYDCAQIVVSIIALLHQALDSPTAYTLHIIIFAFRCEVTDLMAKAIRLRGSAINAPLKKSRCKLVDYAPGISCVDPGSWSLSQWRGQSIDHVWALSRVNTLGGSPSERATRYLDLMTHLGEHEARKKKRKRIEDETSEESRTSI